jgi:aurora kinase
MSAKEQLKK